MKNILSFLVGSVSSFGVANALSDTVQVASESSGTLIDSFEAFISLIGGILSAFLVDWFKRKVVDKKNEE